MKTLLFLLFPLLLTAQLDEAKSSTETFVTALEAETSEFVELLYNSINNTESTAIEIAGSVDAFFIHYGHIPEYRDIKVTYYRALKLLEKRRESLAKMRKILLEIDSWEGNVELIKHSGEFIVLKNGEILFDSIRFVIEVE